MKTKLTFLAIGTALAFILTFTVMQIQAQDEQVDEQWEYLFVDYTIRVDFQPLNSTYLNGRPYEFEGTVYDLYASLGADGWEYVGIIDDSNLFKRRM